jgi:peptidoglycan/LPS O-acetylase OafA/YrhL
MTFSRFYLPQLDGLRFLAFASVFLAHGMWGTPRPWLARLQPVGNYGVDLFFVLSSYLLTTLLLREQAATGRIHVIAFWLRRGLRIWPLYVAVVLGLAVATSLSWWYVLGLATFAFNWQLTVPFTGTPALLTAMTLLWSLSVEEQFYWVWPV